MRVVAFGDTGPDWQRDVARAADAAGPAAVAFLGDITDSDAPRERRKAMRRWARDMAPVGDRLVAVPGNHDHEPDGALAVWTAAVRAAGGLPYAPGEGLTARVGDLEIVGLGTGAGAHRPDPSALAVLRERIAREADPPRARVAILHEPLVPSGAHIGRSLDAHPVERDALALDLARMDVRLVLCGHEHAYVRRTLAVPGSPGRELVQVTAGGGGAALDPNCWADVAVFESRHHVVTVDLLGDRLWIEAHDLDGALLDRFSIELGPASDPAGRRPPTPVHTPRG